MRAEKSTIYRTGNSSLPSENVKEDNKSYIRKKWEAWKKYLKKKEKERKESLKDINVITLSYTKVLIAFVVIISEIQIFLSYVLAFQGKDNIAESLSSNIVTVCLGSIGFYAVKALIENVCKHNRAADIKEQEILCEQKEIGRIIGEENIEFKQVDGLGIKLGQSEDRDGLEDEISF